MKLMERMKQKKMGNKGFSLVELIIVIAIMAILIGIIGTQVVPYLKRARAERDMQIIDSYATAAVTMYSLNSDLFAKVEPSGKVTFWAFSKTINSNPASSDLQSGTDVLSSKIAELTGYDATSLQAAMVTPGGKKIQDIKIEIDFSTGTATATGVDAQVGNNPVPDLRTAKAILQGKPTPTTPPTGD